MADDTLKHDSERALDEPNWTRRDVIATSLAAGLPW